MSKNNNDSIRTKIEELTDLEDTISRNKIIAKLQLSTQKLTNNLFDLNKAIPISTCTMSLSDLLQLYIQLEYMLEEVHSLRHKYDL